MILEQLKAAVQAFPGNLIPESFFRLSDSGSCERLLDLEAQNGRKPIGFEDHMRFLVSKGVHEHVQAMLIQAMPNDFYYPEGEVFMELEGYRVPGHCDGRIRSLKATVEIKSCSENTFTMIRNQNAPIEAHIAQGNAYAGCLGDQFVLILYVNRSTGECLEFYFEFDPELFARTKQKFRDRLGYKAAKIVVPRPYHDASQAPCWYCEWKTDCYKDFKGEVERAKHMEITSSEIVGHGRLAWDNRNVRLKAEKIEKEAKDKLGQILIGRLGAKTATLIDSMGKINVTLKVGTKDNLLVDLKEVKV